MKILVIEDDQTVAQTLRLLFSAYNYAVDIAEDGEAGLRLTDAYQYDLIVLDIILPKLDGISLCQRLRRQGIDAPILLLTGQSSGPQKAIAFHAGADDYVVKPFESEELIARVQALLRRGRMTSQSILTWGQLAIDPANRKVSYGTHLLAATPKEYAILELFLRHPQKALNARVILDQVWSSVESPGEEAVRVHIKELRQKLAAVGAPKDFIQTKHRIGYQLNPQYSNFLATQVTQNPTVPQAAELAAVNQSLQLALEELRVAQEELRQQNETLQSMQQILELRVAERTAELMATNHALQQQQDQWQALFDHALDAIVILNDNWEFVNANPSACQLFGLSKEALLSAKATDFTPSDWDIDPIWQQFRQQGQLSAEGAIQLTDGTIRRVEFSAIANFIPGRHLSIMRDVSEKRRLDAERQQVEAALKQSEDTFRHFAENSDAVIWMADPTGLHNLYASPAYEVIWGRSCQSLMEQPKTWIEAVHPDDHDRVLAKLEQEHRGQNSSMEYRIVRPDGTVRWVWDRGFAIRNEAGQIYRYGGIAEDITDRKQTEIALHQREEFLSRIYNGADQAIFVIDVTDSGDYRYIAFNGRSEQYAGVCQQSIEGKTPEAVFGNAVGSTFRKNYDRCCQSGTSITYEEKVTLESHTLWTLTTLSPSRNEQGQIDRIVGTAIDISDRKQLEIALQESEALLRLTLDLTATGVWEWHLATNKVTWSTSLYRLLGYQPGTVEPSYQLWRDHIHPNQTEDTEQKLNHALANHTDFVAEFLVMGQDGNQRWVLSKGHGLYDETGQPVRMIGVAFDISDRKQSEVERRLAEAALQESERQLSTLMHNLPGYAYRVANDPNYTPEFISKGVFHITGYQQEEYLVQRTISCGQEMHPDDVEPVWHIVQQAVAAHQPYECEYRIITKTGQEKWVWERGQGIYTPDGTLLFLEGFVTDISDRKRAEDALRTSERQYHQILDSISDMVFVKQPNSQLVWVNKAFRAYYGMGLTALQGMIDGPFNPPGITRQYLRDDAFVFATGQTLEIPEEPITRHDGQQRIFSTIKAPINDDMGQVVLLVGVSRDITDRKQAELALQQQVLREQLIADISQDIRRSLSLENVLSRTVERVREFLNTDRVIIFRFHSNWQGDVIMESVGSEWVSTLTTTINDSCFRDRYVEPYYQGRVGTIFDIDQADIKPCYRELLQQFQVKANLVVPILQGENLWGLLIAHHCAAPRQWQPVEIDLLRQLATQVGIAIQQSELYQQTQIELQERERMQAVLEESEERFRSINAAAPIGICQTNADGICLYTNARWHQMSGLSFEESLGNGWLQAVHPDDRAILTRAWETYVNGGSECLPEFRLLTPQGEVRWIAGKVATMRSGSGEVIGYVGIDEDITERKLAEQKIREQAALLDITADAIFVHDLNHHILYWNQGAERLYGWQATEVIGTVAYEVLQHDVDRVTEIMQLLFSQESWRGELHKVTKTGQKVVVEARWTLVRNQSGEPKFILSVDTDITEKKQLEAQFYRAQRLESLGTLASGIAHDLNNVLTPILAISQLLRLNRPNLETRSQELLQVLENSAKRGANMVNQILTFTRGTSGDRIPLKVGPLLQEVINVAQQTFPKSITIHHHIPDQSLWLVSADATHLHQVFMNLCVNARDAMPRGGILTLTAENYVVDAAFAQINLDAKVGTYVVVTIADTGTGIPLDVRDRIFDPFFTTKPTGQGTGLGLSTVLGIVRNYGGFVQVFSEVGQGSQFKLYLPTVEGITPEIAQIEALSYGNGELVLIVDDDLAVQHISQSLLESYHYTTLVANDGIEAIALYTHYQSEIKVVLIDVMMPNMDGVAVVQTLRQMNPRINIIAMSGIYTNRDAILAAGARVFLAKPYTAADLLRQVALLLLDTKKTQDG